MRIESQKKDYWIMFAELIIRERCQLSIYAASDSRKCQREAIYAKTTRRLMRPRRTLDYRDIGYFFVN